MILFSLARCWLRYLYLVGIQRQKITSLYASDFLYLLTKVLGLPFGAETPLVQNSVQNCDLLEPVVEVVACATAFYVHKSLSEVHRSVNQTYTVAAAWKRDLFALVNSSPTAHSWLCSVTVPTVSCCTHTVKWWLLSCVTPLKCLCACSQTHPWHHVHVY